MYQHTAAWLTLWCVCLVGAALLGCGVKGDPVAPHSSVPQAVADLQVLSRRGTIALEWSIPTKDLEGKRLAELGGFHLWRQFTPLEKIGCTTCKAELQLLANIDYRLPQNARRSAGKMVYWDDRVEKEGHYAYTVTSYTTAEVESGASNSATLMWFAPAAPAGALKATPGDRVVDLTWEIPTAFAGAWSKEAAVGWNVYRRGDKEPYGLQALNANPVTGTTFRDTAAVNGTPYWYVVRPLRSVNGFLIEGKDSPEANAMPEDLSAPAPPLAAMAFQSPEGIVVVWEPSLDPDLAGYFIYRRGENEAAPKRISALLANQTMYTDKDYVHGMTYYYSITAIDCSPRQNESDFSRELKVVTHAP